MTPRRATASLLITFFLLTLCFFVVLTIVPIAVRATTLYVGGIGPGNYTSIQDALLASQKGDTVFVYGGRYDESVYVYEMRSLVGENKYSTTINGSVLVVGSWVNISGFKIIGDSWAGIRTSCKCILEHLTIFDNIIETPYGVFLNSTVGMTMFNNTMVGGGIDWLDHYDNHVMFWNTHSIDTSNTVNGQPVYYWKNVSGGTVPQDAGEVILANVTDVTVANQVIHGTNVGVVVAFSENVTLDRNHVYSSQKGVSLQFSRACRLSNNQLGFNWMGAYLYFDEGSHVNNNNFSDNYRGIMAEYVNNTVIVGNLFSVNTVTGLEIGNPSRNLRAYHNTFWYNNRGAQNSGPNYWDDGYPSGGNYWNDYTGIDNFSGPNQNLPGSDDIGDTPYNITWSAQDRYPLMKFPPYAPSPPSDPLDLRAIPGNGLVSLAWSPPTYDGGSPITNYSVYRGIVPGGEVFLTEIGNVLTYTDMGLTNGQPYYYQVTAKNAAGEGARSNEAGATPTAGPTVPGPPIVLAATGGIRQITLTWSPPLSNGGSPITNYTVYRGSVSNGESFLAEIGNVLTYVDTGLGNGQRFYYEVSARNAVGDGARTNEASARTLMVPGPPIGLAATAGNGQVALSWSPPIDNGGSPVTNYRVYRGTVSGGESFIVQLGNALVYVDSGLVNGETYFYEFSAVNAVGEGQLSYEASATPTSGLNPPSEPQSLQATPGDRRVTLTWAAPISDGGTPITRYVVYRGLASGGETFLAEIGNVSTYIDAGLVNGQTYFYKVSAVNMAGEGAKSNEASATPLTPPPPNLRPTCNILSPVLDSTVVGTYRITGIASDVDGTVQKVEIRIDNGEWIEATGNTSWIYDWDTTGVSDGQHTVHARSYDGIDDSVEASVTVTVDNAPQVPPQETSAYQWAFWIVLVAAIAETFLLLFLLLKGRRGKKPEEGQQSGSASDEGAK